MPKLHPAPAADVADDVFAELQSYLAGPERPAPPGFRLKLAALLASTIGRVRLFETTEGRRTKLLEFAVGGGVEAADTGIAAARLATAAERAGLHAGEDVEVALDLTVDPATGSLSIDLAAERVLEGQDLASLAAAAAPGPAPPVRDFDLPLDDSYLTAADAARLLGVAKSTVTRRIEKNELVGFRVFKNALRIPRDQFMDGDVVDGLADVLALFAIDGENGETVIDHKSAWAFLGSTVYPGDAAPRPIDRLRAASPGRAGGAAVAELARVKRSLDHGDHI